MRKRGEGKAKEKSRDWCVTSIKIGLLVVRIVLFYVTSVLKSLLTQKGPVQWRVKNHWRYQESISNQTKTGNFLLLCMPELWTVFSWYFASKTEGLEVHDLQRAFGKLNQRFSAKFLGAELNVLNRLVFASHIFWNAKLFIILCQVFGTTAILLWGKTRIHGIVINF